MGALIPPRDDASLGEGYHSPQVPVAVRLNTNESPFPPPPGFTEALASAVAAIPFHRYPDRDATALRTGLAELEGVRPDQVFCANGSNEVLQTLLLTYGGPGRAAAVFEPTYALHSHIARITATTVATGGRAADFSLDLDDVKRVVNDSAAEITFVCSPNNPTGGAESRATIEHVLQLAPGLLVVDEAYGQFAPWSAIELVDDDVPLVVIRTFSKTWSMAAARLGYLVGPAPIVASLQQRALPYHLDAMKQVAGTLALGYRTEMQARVASVVEERGRLFAGLATLPVRVWPSDANFILFQPERTAATAVWHALVERSILVRDCSSWSHLDNCLRVTVGTPDENTAFLDALWEILR